MIRRAVLLAAGCCLLLWQPAAAQDAMALLDEAKMTMAGGKLERALKLLTELEPAGNEPLVDQEILFQRMLLNASFLAASHYLLEELESGEFANSAYAAWLRDQRSAYREEFLDGANELLRETAENMALDFVRFRLPEVTDEYLEDAGLYADAQVLTAACTNYDDGREGLGRGVVVAQARIALVLFAAEFYDLPDAADSLEHAADRLRAGVPLEEAQFLFWLEDLAMELSGGDEALVALAERAADRADDRRYRAPRLRMQSEKTHFPAAAPEHSGSETASD